MTVILGLIRRKASVACTRAFARSIGRFHGFIFTRMINHSDMTFSLPSSFFRSFVILGNCCEYKCLKIFSYDSPIVTSGVNRISMRGGAHLISTFQFAVIYCATDFLAALLLAQHNLEISLNVSL